MAHYEVKLYRAKYLETVEYLVRAEDMQKFFMKLDRDLENAEDSWDQVIITKSSKLSYP